MITYSLSRVSRVTKVSMTTRFSETGKRRYSMYAIVLTGGKQYKVAQGEIIKVEKIDKEIGAKVELDVVMLNNDGNIACGKEVEKSKVVAEVVAQDKAKKIVVFKYKSKKNERKRQGHRQPFTALKIAEIKA